MSLNNWNANGRLTDQVEMRYTQNGVGVLNFTLAVKRNYKNDAGNYEADFINCVMWGSADNNSRVETLSNYLNKGTLVNVVGRLQSRSYENQNGFTVYVVEANVHEIDLLSQPKEIQEAEQQQQQQTNTRGRNNNNRSQSSRGGRN